MAKLKKRNLVGVRGYIRKKSTQNKIDKTIENALLYASKETLSVTFPQARPVVELGCQIYHNWKFLGAAINCNNEKQLKEELISEGLSFMARLKTPARSLLVKGLGAIRLKVRGLTAEKLYSMGYKASKLRSPGFSPDELIRAGVLQGNY